MKLPIGISDFEELVTGNYDFADKTLFIRDIVNDGAKIILITRPRRFGKTLNLSMLFHFLQSNRPSVPNLFGNLAIAEDHDFCSQHQNKYPVISISFKDIKKSSFAEAYPKIVHLISQLYQEHRYLLDGDYLYSDEKELVTKFIRGIASQSDVEDSLALLAKYITKKWGKLPVILIDEYDTPIQESYLKGYYPEMMDFIRSILGQVLKDNSNIKKAIIIGITRVSQESLFSGVNNLEVYSLLREQFGKYFGFSEDEVNKLVNKAGYEKLLLSIKDWYKGYHIGKYLLYNPWSIINCLKNEGKLQPYWLNTSSNDIVVDLLTEADYSTKNQFELLLQGHVIEKPILENLEFTELKDKEEALWSLLLYAGYLNVTSNEIKGFQLMAKISVPNKEVMYIYDGIVAGWFRKGTSLESYKNFTDSLKAQDIDKFKQHLSEFVAQNGSYFDFNKNSPEKIFHSFMLGLTVGLKDEYDVATYREPGKGNFDILFLPKVKQRYGIFYEQKKGMVIGFRTSALLEKLTSKARETLIKLDQTSYLQMLNEHNVSKVLLLAAAFHGKNLVVSHEILHIR